MKMQVNRYGISVYPETPQDEAFIEEVLGLKKDGDKIHIIRRNAIGLSSLACLETRRIEKE
jgi:hypothetical protein